MLRSRFIILAFAIVLFASTPIKSYAKSKSIVLNKTIITDFFDGVSIEINKPIVVSNKAGLFEISGEIDLTEPYKAIENVANKTNLIWYDNGSAIYVYSSDELKNDFVTINNESDFNQIVKFLKLSDLYSETYPLRYTKGAGFVSGPPMYVKVVKDSVAAYYNGLASDKKPEKPEPIEVIKMYPLRNRFVADMRYFIRGNEKVVEGALTILKRLINERSDAPKNVNIVADTLNNALYVKGMAKDVNDLETLISEIDIIREQIQLSLWIIDVDSSEIKEMGTSLEGNLSSDIFKAGLNGGSVILNQSQTLSFVGAVNFLENQRKAKVLSRPVLITQNNTPAVIDTNETIYVRLIGEQEVSLKEITYGTILSVTPRVVKSPSGNDIEMMVEIEDGNQTADLIDGIPNIRRSVISTVGRINDSQSLLLGGFVRKEVTNQNRGIPVLKDIPFVKYLFSMDVENTTSVMRLFMIEPKIIEDPVAEFNRSRIINMQSEPFFQQRSNQPINSYNFNNRNENVIQSVEQPRRINENPKVYNTTRPNNNFVPENRGAPPVNQTRRKIQPQQRIEQKQPVVSPRTSSTLDRRQKMRKQNARPSNQYNNDIIDRKLIKENMPNIKYKRPNSRRVIRHRPLSNNNNINHNNDIVTEKELTTLPKLKSRKDFRNKIRKSTSVRNLNNY